MRETLQQRDVDICETKELGCNSIYCEAPDYVRRSMFLNDPKKETLFASVAKSVISNLASRSLENVERDPLVIAETYLPEFSCVRATASSFSRDELGTFFAKACAKTIGRVASAISSKTATREDAFLYECLIRIGTRQEIKDGGGINREELISTLEWYFSGDDSEVAPKGAEKYIDFNKPETQKRPISTNISRYDFNTHPKRRGPKVRTDTTTEISSDIPFLESNSQGNCEEKEDTEKSLLTPREKAIVTLCAQGKAMGKIAETLAISFDRISINARTIVEKFDAKHIQQVIFQMISEGEINLAEVVDKFAVTKIKSLDPDELNLLDLITTPPYQLVTNEDLAEKICRSPRILRSRFLSIRNKLFVPSNIVAGIAYIAYKQKGV